MRFDNHERGAGTNPMGRMPTPASPPSNRQISRERFKASRIDTIQHKVYPRTNPPAIRPPPEKTASLQVPTLAHGGRVKPGHDAMRALHSSGFAGIADDLQDMHPGVGAVDDIDKTAVVGFDVVGLDGDLAAILAVDLDAALVGVFGD